VRAQRNVSTAAVSEPYQIMVRPHRGQAPRALTENPLKLELKISNF